MADDVLGRDDSISIATGWVRSVTYVSALSLWALVAGYWATWQAARVEVAQQQEIERREDDPTEEKVVDAMLRRTDVEPTNVALRPNGEATTSQRRGS